MAIEPRWTNTPSTTTPLNATRLNLYTRIRGDFTNPNGNVSGSPGDTYHNTTGGANQTLWVKESGTGTTSGWTALPGAGAGGGVASVSPGNGTITIGGTSTNPTVAVSTATLNGKADLVSSVVPTSELGVGTANSTTFLRGDQTWATPSGSGGGALGTGTVFASCRLATTGSNITLSGSPLIDGTSPVANDRILVKDQTNAVENGIYVAANSGWSRASEMAAGTVIQNGAMVSVREGNTNAASIFEIYSNNVDHDTFTVGTHTPIMRSPINNIQAAGSAVNYRNVLNFAGSGVAVTDDATNNRTNITIGGSGGSASNFTVRLATTASDDVIVLPSDPNAPGGRIDNTYISPGDRIFRQFTSDPTLQGIYVVNSVGSSWTRSTDMAAGAVIPNGALVYVSEGADWGKSTLQLSSPIAGSTGLTVGTTQTVVTPWGVPGYTTLTPDGNGLAQMYIDNNYFCQLGASGSNVIFCLHDPSENYLSPTPGVIKLLVQQSSTGGRRWDVAPSTIVWDNGYIPGSGIIPPWDLSAGVNTYIEFKWMGPGVGWFGSMVTSIPPLYSYEGGSVNWTNTLTSPYGPWQGVNPQLINMSVVFGRWCGPLVRTQVYNTLTAITSAALRQRFANNNHDLEIGVRYNTDGPVAGHLGRGGNEAFGGWSSGVLPPTPSCSTFGAFGPYPNDAIGGIAHEICHGVNNYYFNGNNSADPQGQAFIDQHPVLVALKADCVANADPSNPPAGGTEWFAECERFRRAGDNGPILTSPPATNGISQMMGTGTNVGGVGGTPSQRYTRFANYMVSILGTD